MKQLLPIAFFVLAAALMLAGCGGSENPVNTSNTSSANTASNGAANSNNPLAVSTPTPEQTVNNAPTFTPVVHGYYEALRNKDDAGIRRVLSKDFVRSIEEDMKSENRKDLAAFLAETDKVPEKPVEVRNEKFQGDKGYAEIRGGVYAAWTPFEFVKEDGVWKFSGGSPAIDNVSKTATGH